GGTGLVVRPAAAGSGAFPQTLVFLADEVRTLEGGSRGEPFRLGPQQLALTDGATPGGSMAYALQKAGHAVFEASSGCVFFGEGTAVMRLNPSNEVTLAAGSKEQSGNRGGVGEAARFSSILALAADGRGAVFVAEPSSIRKLSFNGAGSNAASERTAAVTTLLNTAPPAYQWRALAYSAAAGGGLLAAAPYAVYLIPLRESGSPGGPPALLAGDPAAPGRADGCGAAARFNYIHSMHAGAGGCVYIADNWGLRKLDVARRTVSTVQACSFNFYSPALLAILPSGHMVGTSQERTDLQVLAGIFASSSLLQPKARAAGQEAAEELVKHLLASTLASSSANAGSATASGTSGDAGGNSGSKRRRASGDASSSHGANGNSSADTSGVVTVRVGDKAFIVHRSLLAYHSDYFKQLFESGFADSAAAEVVLSDADPDVFGLLLAYMYRGFLELAERLLMFDVRDRLAQQLLAGCTPASAVRDLLWAERHNMGELVAQLKV
ncbi:hypothetical protein TSOC_014566, partial [Tetrabaena socialis]